MNDAGNDRAGSCARARELVHRMLDGDTIEVEERRELEDHLAVCSDCRDASTELSAIQATLQRLPGIPLPDRALSEVWERTSRASPARETTWRWLDWRTAAAAAAVVVVLLAIWQGRRSPELGHTPEEIAHATEQARMVLGLTARTLHEAKEKAIHDVLEEEVSPALRRVPIQWPGESTAAGRESRDDDV